ncbi:hypothetical protein AB0H73_19530 [Streptomyces olivoreticuli]
MPFPAAINADLARAEAHNLQWARRYGLLVSDEAERRYRSWALPVLTARTNPLAGADDLDLALDMMTIMFLFDDQFDGPLGIDRPQASSLSTRLAALARPNPDPVEPTGVPLIDAWADLWIRCAHEMSITWQERAARNFRNYFLAHAQEVGARAAGVEPNPLVYLGLRKDTVGMRPLQDLIERVNGFELAPQVHDTAHLREMRELAGLVVALNNDISSLEKESLRKETHNLVVILLREQGASQEQAISRIVAMAKEHVERFLVLQDSLPTLCSELHLDEEQQIHVHRFVVGMRHWMRGCYDWEAGSARYSAINQLPATGPGYVEDLVTPR